MTARAPGRAARLAETCVVATVALTVAAALAVPASAGTDATPAPGDVITVDGVSVTAPDAGRTVSIVVDRVDGTHTTITVETQSDGTVVVTDGDATSTVSTASAEPQDGPPKCDDSAYSLINGAAWDQTYAWHFRAGTTPAGLAKKQVTKALKASVGNITGSRNGCGLADEVSATASYGGKTTQESDVTSQPACKASPGPQNVTEFGPMPSGILAATCTYSTGGGGTITDADVRINTAYQWWTGGSCSGRYSIRAVQTHEYGHAFGLGHVSESEHGNLTMSTAINGTCSDFEASLGRGDVLALRDLY